jgi:FMN phosphatase YigB (HAD superfamily)
VTPALKAALVDVGGTLWPDRWPDRLDAVYRQRLQAALPTLRSTECRQLLDSLAEEDPADKTNLLEQDTRAGIARALRRCSAADDPRTVDRVLAAMDLPARGAIDLFPGAPDLLSRIRSLGLQCVVVSNATYRDAEAYLRDFEDLGVAPYVDAVVSSIDVGSRKPGTRIFQVALETAGCHAPEAVVIGDSEEKDILPAIRLGMRTILVAIETPLPAASRAGALATSLEDAAAIVTGWATHRSL